MSEACKKISSRYKSWFQRTPPVETIPDIVKEQFPNFSKDRKILSDSDLKEFLIKVQKETEAEAVETLERWKTFSNKTSLEDKEFSEFLFNIQNPAVRQQTQEDDLKHRLPCYFMHTSNHSYFSDPNFIQQKTASIQSKLAKALTRGVRVIELNLDSNLYGNVEVSYEWNPKSSGTISKCLDTIKDCAFEKSKLPLIIILEKNHINRNLQDIVAANVKNKLEGMLCSSNEALNYNLEELKNKIIILSRQPKPEEEKFSEDYQNLITGYIEDRHDPGLNLQNDEASQVRFFSCKEDGLKNVNNSDITSFTQKNILAIDLNPIPTDGESVTTLYEPFVRWTRGAQIINAKAENPRKRMTEKYIWLRQGLFRAYGGTGYVKKPDILLDSKNKFDPTAWRPIKKILKITAYMGTGFHLDFANTKFDPTSDPDFYAGFQIIGVPEDESQQSTVPVMNQWIPKWDQEFEFPLTVPELAMLMIQVRDFDPNRKHLFAGQTCLPVWLLREGIRSVPLHTETGSPLENAKLLIKIEFKK